MKKEYVFHGSPVKVEKLIPNQACDIEYKEGTHSNNEIYSQQRFSNIKRCELF